MIKKKPHPPDSCMGVAWTSGEGGGEGRIEAMASMTRRRNCCEAFS